MGALAAAPPGAFSGADRWRLRDWCSVVRARDRVVLVDTGSAARRARRLLDRDPGRLPEELAAAGVEPDEDDREAFDRCVRPLQALGVAELLDRVETERMWLAPSHLPEPFGTVARTADGRRWQGRP